MEMTMSLAQMYERRTTKITDTNESAASKLSNRVLRLKAPPLTPPTPTSIGMPPAAPLRHFKCLTTEETTKHLQIGLCFNYVEPFTHGRKCRHLFDITTINDYDADDVDNNLLMMLGMT
jgi:hypothetical protein